MSIEFWLDLSLFIVINSANFFAFLMFLGRVKNKSIAKISGDLFIILGIPLALIVIGNFILIREWWYWIFPSILLVFILYTFIVDYVQKLEFRNPKKYSILIPFLFLYYLGLILTWGVIWVINIILGFLTSITYFMQVFASIYAQKHGVG